MTQSPYFWRRRLDDQLKGAAVSQADSIEMAHVASRDAAHMKILGERDH